MSAHEMEKQEAIGFDVVQELQRELEKQANIIFQLRQDNVTLRCKLDSEQETSQSYAEQIQQIEHEWHTPQKPLCTSSRVSAELSFRQGMFASTDNLFPLTKNGALLTIRTQPMPCNLEEGWGDDAEVMSVSDVERDVVCDETGERSECHMRRTPRQSCSLFFYKRKNKQSKGGRASFVHVPRPVPPTSQPMQSSESTGRSTSQVSTQSDEAVSQTSARTQKAPQPVMRKNTEDACLDSLSRIGWTDSDLGQKLVLIKESYSKNTDVFADDVRFMREVLDGKSHAPEMDIEEELCNVLKDFKAWKKQFDESVQDLEAALKTSTTPHTRHEEAIATGSLENKKEGVTGRSSVISSIGKFLHRTIA